MSSQLYVLHIGYYASCKRSFSKLKLIKTCIRSSILQERLTSLALICIGREFLSADVKNEVVQIFSDKRAIVAILDYFHLNLDVFVTI